MSTKFKCDVCNKEIKAVAKHFNSKTHKKNLIRNQEIKEGKRKTRTKKEGPRKQRKDKGTKKKK